MTPQSSVNFPKTHLKRAQNSEKHYKKRVDPESRFGTTHEESIHVLLKLMVPARYIRRMDG